MKNNVALNQQDFECLLEANRILSSKLDVRDVLDAILNLAARVVKAEAASLLLVDELANELYFDVTIGNACAAVKNVRLKIGEGIAGWVAAKRTSVVVNNVGKDPRWNPTIDMRSGFVTSTVAAVPISYMGTLIGVLEAINKKENAEFNGSDTVVLEAFASQAAVALENARLFSNVLAEKWKMATILSEMSDGVLLFDCKGVISLMNFTAARMFGIAPEIASRQLKFDDVIKMFAVKPPLDGILAGYGDAYTHVEFSRTAGEKLHLSGSLRRFKVELNEPSKYLLIVQDVTEAKREEKLKRNFLSLISHKLKTPLSVLDGYTEMLLDRPANLTDVQKRAWKAVYEESRNLSKLVDKLITFTIIQRDIEEIEPKAVTLEDAVKLAREGLTALIEGKATEIITDDSVSYCPPVLADMELLVEVFKNIIDNGLKFNTSTKKSVKISVTVTAAVAKVLIADNGSGVPPEQVDKVFQPFYQFEESFTGQVEGMGLGLALVKKVIESFGGSVGLTTDAGKGCEFYFTLPLAYIDSDKAYEK